MLGEVDDLLFYQGGELRHALKAQGEKMRRAVEAEPEESLKQADVEEWAAALAYHFSVTCPELKTDAVWREPPKDVGVDVSHDQMRAIFDRSSDAVRNFPGYRVVIHVPFEGDADVFDLKTNPHSTMFPRGRIKDDELLLTIDYPHDQTPHIDGLAQNFHQPGQSVPRLGAQRDRLLQQLA